MKRLELIDFARFFAAIMVVFFHYTYNGIANGKVTSMDPFSSFSAVSRYGYLGVDLFFMISGYVIFFSAKSNTAAQFAFSRFLRLYPAYWVAVLLTSVFSFYIGSNAMSTDLKTTLINLTMFQSFFDIKDVDGVYWTLVYELKFYFFIFAILMFGLREKLNAIIKTWSLLIFASQILNIEAISSIGGYYSYFVAGALLSIVRDSKKSIDYVFLALTFFSCAMISTEYVSYVNKITTANYNNIVVLFILFLFFVFFLFQNTSYAQNKKFHYSKVAGSLTYPVYLIHAHIGYMLINKFATNENYYYVYPVIMGSIFIVAWLIHYYIEIKLNWLWKELFTICVKQPIESLVGFFYWILKKGKAAF